MNKGEILKVGSTVLPAPTAITVSDEIIWSQNTGRTTAGRMIGEIVAEKKNLSIKWEMLTEAEVKLIRTKLCAGFFSLTFRDDNEDITIQSYRGTMSKEQLGEIGGIFYYRSVSVDVVER